jgi:hypothetical protein
MSEQLTKLTWFTTEQALRYLKQQSSIELTEHDLFSHCEQGNCVALVSTGGRAGKSTSWIEGEDGPFQIVYGDGESQILNPLVLLDSPATSIVRLYLTGQVRETDEPDTSVYPCEEWAVELKPQDIKVRFKRSEIDSFADSIERMGVATVPVVAPVTAAPAVPPVAPVPAVPIVATVPAAFAAAASPVEEIPSHSLVIAALLELLTEPGSRNYNQSRITDEIVKRHGKWYGISDSSLPKLFAACNKAAKEADKLTKIAIAKL